MHKHQRYADLYNTLFYLRASYGPPPREEFSRSVENPLVAFGCFVFFGPVVVSLTYSPFSPFQFSIFLIFLLFVLLVIKTDLRKQQKKLSSPFSNFKVRIKQKSLGKTSHCTNICHKRAKCINRKCVCETGYK